MRFEFLGHTSGSEAGLRGWTSRPNRSSGRCFRFNGLVSLFITISLVLISCNQAGTPSATPTPSPTPEPRLEGRIVAIGNSLTEGLGVEPELAYPDRLERKLQENGYKFEVINAGVTGESSSGTLARIDWVLSSLEPDIIILETGANDGLRGVDPAVTEENLTRIITRIKGEDRTVVLAGMEIVVNMGSEYTTAFSGIYPRVAEQQGVILIPFFLKNVAAEPQLNQPDGVHPTAEGYKVVTETVYPYVVEAIKVWRVAHLQ